MFVYFLIEDQSGECLIREIMKKYNTEHPNVEYDCKAFKGIGGLPKGGSASNVKTRKLLSDLPQYLRGFDKSLKHSPDTSVFVVLDNDRHDVQQFGEQLRAKADSLLLTIDHVFCIAVEEMEAWILGDKDALKQAFPKLNSTALNAYEQDSICGTWEVLANVVYKGGLKQFKKDCPTYQERGKYKSLWAKEVGPFFDIRTNESPSFQLMIGHLDRRSQIR